MELRDDSLILYQRCHNIETKQDIPLFEVIYHVKTDNLVMVTVFFNRQEGLFVRLDYRDYEFYEEIHVINPENQLITYYYPALENIETGLTAIVKKYLGFDMVFEHVKGAMIHDLLFFLNQTDR